MTSREANCAAKRGLEKAFPDSRIDCFDASDGGEGFLEAMRPDEIVRCHVHDAMMRWTNSAFGIKDGKAIIEVAKTVGLAMIEPELRNPLVATSYGVGELMVRAMEHGCREFIVGLGGSATSDCGLGMLRCLRRAWQIRENKAWHEPFDISFLKNIKVTLATDVRNPLCGEHGAARVFAPQKGADAGMVEKLERRARTFAATAARHQGFDMSNEAGAGAAGGLGYAFMQFMDAKVESGADLVIRSNGIASALSQDYLAPLDESGRGRVIVVTGEGSADSQTLMGKWPSVVLAHAKETNTPVVLLAGRIADREMLDAVGFSQVACINDGQRDDEDALLKTVAMQRMEWTCSHCISVPNTNK